jgi:hypothetical protein
LCASNSSGIILVTSPAPTGAGANAIGEAEPGQRRIEHLESAVEDELAFDMHLQFATVFLELLGVQSATGGQTQIDAVVAD